MSEPGVCGRGGSPPAGARPAGGGGTFFGRRLAPFAMTSSSRARARPHLASAPPELPELFFLLASSLSSDRGRLRTRVMPILTDLSKTSLSVEPKDSLLRDDREVLLSRVRGDNVDLEALVPSAERRLRDRPVLPVVGSSISRALTGARSRYPGTRCGRTGSITRSADCALILSSDVGLFRGTIERPALTVSSNISRSVEPNESKLNDDRESFRARSAAAGGFGRSRACDFSGSRLSYFRPREKRTK